MMSPGLPLDGLVCRGCGADLESVNHSQLCVFCLQQKLFVQVRRNERKLRPAFQCGALRLEFR